MHVYIPFGCFFGLSKLHLYYYFDGKDFQNFLLFNIFVHQFYFFSKHLQDSKTKSLMDLEMRDYELTVSELQGQLAEKDTNITELQAEIEREKRRSGSLQDQLVHLSTQEATERERAEKMKVWICAK